MGLLASRTTSESGIGSKGKSPLEVGKEVCVDQTRAARRQTKLYSRLGKMSGRLPSYAATSERDDIKYDLARSKRSMRGVFLCMQNTAIGYWSLHLILRSHSADL